MSMNKVLTVASEIAKKGTFHAYHNRIREAVYLYKLSCKFMDHILDTCAQNPGVLPEQTIEVVKRSRDSYMNFIKTHPEGYPLPVSSTSSSPPSLPGSTTVQTPIPPPPPPTTTAAAAAIPPPAIPPPATAPPPATPANSQSASLPKRLPVGKRSMVAPKPPPKPASMLSGSKSSGSRSPSPGVEKNSFDSVAQPPLPAVTSLRTSGSASPQNEALNDIKVTLTDMSAMASPTPVPLTPTGGSKEEENPYVLIKKAMEEKRANNLDGSIQIYEKVIELLFKENRELKAKIEQQQNEIASSSSHPVSSFSVPPLTSAGAASSPVPMASPPQMPQDESAVGGSGSNSSSISVSPVGKGRVHSWRRNSNSPIPIPGGSLQSATDLMSALENVSNVSTIDYVNDKVDFHERLGGGGSGAVVLRATCKGLTFAAKMLPGEMPPEVREGVLSEISVMTRLDHQNVARYLGHDLSKHNKVMLYMEYYTETLSGVLKKRKAEGSWITPEEVTKWSMQIAKGLQYLHSLSPPLIHRDLKSENVFVLYDSQGRVETLKIGDFDTAKITEKAKVAFTKNLGTVGFMAPEVCNPTEKGYNEKADIWSFGMVMYEMMQMDVPFYNVPMLQRYDFQAKGVRPTLDLGSKVSSYKEQIDVFKKCTEKNPTLRPTAKKVVKTLAAIL